MNETEFIKELLNKVLPNVEWYGETCHDNKALKGLDVVFNAAYYCLTKLLDTFYLPAGNENNYSANMLYRRTRELFEILVDDLDLKEKIKDMEELENE